MRAITRRLQAMGAEGGEEIAQADLYLMHPSRDFARSDEALRLRQDGTRNVVTYKGPKRGGPTKTREEIEIPFEPGEDARRRFTMLFDRLGFRPVADIHKVRRSYQMEHDGRDVTVALDRAEGLGTFAEVEAIAMNESDLPDAQAVVLALGRMLGLVEVEPRSYLRMTLDERGGNRADSPGRS